MTKFAMFGCGRMAKYLVKYAREKSGNLVAAFDVSPSVVGKSVREILNLDFDLAISDAKNAEEILSREKPDVVIIATRSTIRELREILLICANLGISAITTCEEAIFPWNSTPEITRKIDEIAQKTGAKICGSGYPDVYWGELISTLAGSVQKITKIVGSSSYNVEDYGIALAEGHGAGLSLDEFDAKIGKFNSLNSDEIREKIESGEIAPPYMWNQNGWLCAKFGLTPISQTQKSIPQIAETELNSETLQMKIPAGFVRGMSAKVITETREGIILETESVGKVYAAGEVDTNEWTIFGEPETSLKIARPATVELTCATIVNRIPQLLKFPRGGYITTNELPRDEFAREI